MLLFVSAGEPSGDLRAAELCRELSARSPGIGFFGLGGDDMEASGVTLSAHLEEFSVMGFSSVLKSLGRILSLEKRLRRECLERRPDAVLLVDYPGFNLRMARWASRRGFPVIYHISPQFWAWGGWRARGMARHVDLVTTLFEFEAGFHAALGVDAVWCGHPLVESIPRPSPGGGDIALLPGSRPDEVERLMEPMLGCVELLRRAGDRREAVVAVSRTVPGALYSKASALGCRLVEGTSAALSSARVALVCSGTATLEASLHGVPFVLMYRTSPLNYSIARLLVRGVDRICLASIASGRTVAPELIQGDATAEKAFDAVLPLLGDTRERRDALEAAGAVRDALGPPGAAGRAAEAILKKLWEMNVV